MIPDDAKDRIDACTRRTLSADELVTLLDDDRDHLSTGYTSFDGDATAVIEYVSVSALWALAGTAPQAAPVEKIADVILRMVGRVAQIHTTSYTTPWEVALAWRAEELATFGPGLLDALRARLGDPEMGERARLVLDGMK